MEDIHINAIVDCYRKFAPIGGFSAVATTEEIIENNGSLGVPKYVRNGETESPDAAAIDDTLGEWMAGQATMHEEYDALIGMISDERSEING